MLVMPVNIYPYVGPSINPPNLSSPILGLIMPNTPLEFGNWEMKFSGPQPTAFFIHGPVLPNRVELTIDAPGMTSIKHE